MTICLMTPFAIRKRDEIIFQIEMLGDRYCDLYKLLRVKAVGKDNLSVYLENYIVNSVKG